MGTILLGILGGVKGKVGPIIGASWKGIDYIKGYAIPSNPNTVLQQAQRSLFTFCLSIARLILTTVIQPYWINREAGMSEYNSFMRYNLDNVTADGDYDEVNVARGDLESAAIDTATYVTGTGVFEIEWETVMLGNGLGTDSAIVVVIDSANNIAFVETGETRVDGVDTFNIGSGRTVGDLKAYLFFHRGSGPDLLVSNSSYFQVTAP